MSDEPRPRRAVPASPATPVEAGATPARAAGEAPAPSAGARIASGIKEVLIVVVAALLISTLIRMFIGQMFVIPSGSMEHTLNVDDKVAAMRVVTAHRGDVVVFEDPAHWLPDQPEPTPGERVLEFLGFLPNNSKGYLIKRIIGMPGDKVKCCDAAGRITVNGYALEESDYLYRQNGVPVAPSEVQFEITVPAGRVFVMGDHRNASEDSRCHLAAMGIDAFVPISKIVGPAMWIVLPFDRARRLGPPATFAGVPAPSAPAPSAPQISPANVHC